VKASLSGSDDEEVRAAAISERQVLLTFDADFRNVLKCRRRKRPATEDAIDEMLKRPIPSLAKVRDI
jgi:hypothetical protein